MTRRVRAAVGGDPDHFSEQVHVAILAGKVR